MLRESIGERSFTISALHLVVNAKVPGVDATAFAEPTGKSAGWFSYALDAEITGMDGGLSSHRHREPSLPYCMRAGNSTRNPIPTHTLPLKGRACHGKPLEILALMGRACHGESVETLALKGRACRFKTLPFKGVKGRRSEPKVLTSLNAQRAGRAWVGMGLRRKPLVDDDATRLFVEAHGHRRIAR
ncbi:hypothetical protein ACFJIW_04845 [Tahibacter sp. UC22_41]|uniref:hypothetical protein n=1 Tax=Tahibacter sp. UC22_41 TaxID=3350178 RepID=UPI0036DD3689